MVSSSNARIVHVAELGHRASARRIRRHPLRDQLRRPRLDVEIDLVLDVAADTVLGRREAEQPAE
jgi:hypothetical protein